jgi:hypothetical protein
MVTEFQLNFSHDVVFRDVPLAWTTRFEFFTSDLEQFPLMYVHRKIEPVSIDDVELPIDRVYGFALHATIINETGNGACDIVIKFLCNAPQNIASIDEVVFEELSHRLGLANKVSYGDLEEICRKSPDNLGILQAIWDDRISRIFGGFIPHGKIYDEVFGIIRFSASGNAPRLGKTSELRMLYWYMKDVGQRVTFGLDLASFSFCEFYLLPTMEETRSGDFALFEKFSEYFEAIKSFWDLEYTETFQVSGFNFRYANSDALPRSATEFESRYESLLPSHYDRISELRQIFNRMPVRLYSYIWNMMTFIELGFSRPFSDRENFKIFVKEHHGKKGSSSKVLACILQQCFGLEAFPIDTWVKTFINYPLAINPLSNGKSSNLSKDDLDRLYDSFNHLDKLEKLIWVSSMANKTNKTEFLDILWCQRYGTDKGDDGPCRGANPLSCGQCSIREQCKGFEAISRQMVVVSGDKTALLARMSDESYLFGVQTHDGTPRKVFIREKKKVALRDTHSGHSISVDVDINPSILEVSDFISKVADQ